MPAAKTSRAQLRKAARNRSTRSLTRTRVKAATEAITEGTKSDESDTTLRGAAAALDRAVSKGVLHRNAAARKKSRLARQYNKISS